MFNRIVGVNMLLLLGAAIVSASLTPITDLSTAGLFGESFIVQAGANLLLGLINLRKGTAPYFLSVLLVLLLGFGFCFRSGDLLAIRFRH